MEIRTVFGIIIGIIMMVTITIAAVAMMGGLMSMTVSECVPAEYTATTNPSPLQGYYCGLDTGSNRVYCNKIRIPLPGGHARDDFDTCMDASINLCCPTIKPNIVINSGKCCNITRI